MQTNSAHAGFGACCCWPLISLHLCGTLGLMMLIHGHARYSQHTVHIVTLVRVCALGSPTKNHTMKHTRGSKFGKCVCVCVFMFVLVIWGP